MFRITFDHVLINSVLKKVGDPKLEYRQGCILGQINVPLGSAAVNMVIIPTFNPRHLVFLIPFKEIKGSVTGKLFLSKLVGVFWGTISKEVEKRLVPLLRKAGLPTDTVSLEKSKDPSGDVGKIIISMPCVHRWLAGKHPTLAVKVVDMVFNSQGVEIVGDVEIQKRKLPAPQYH